MIRRKMWVFGVLLVAGGLVCGIGRPAQAIQAETPKSKVKKLEPGVEKQRRISPKAESRDPHWGGLRDSGSGGSGATRPDLVVSRVELKRTDRGQIIARAKVGNLTNCDTTAGASLWFEAEGQPGMGWSPFVGEGFGRGESGWSGWLVLADDDGAAVFRVVVRVDAENRVPEVSGSNNECRTALYRGQNVVVRTCHRIP